MDGEQQPDDVFAQCRAVFRTIPGVQSPVLNVFVMGTPGSGKSAICDIIKTDYGFYTINSGQLLKQEILQVEIWIFLHSFRV